MTANTDLWIAVAYIGYWAVRGMRATWRASDPKRDQEPWWVR